MDAPGSTETPDPPDWNPCLERVRAGDEAAARQLVEDLYPTIIKIVRSHLPRTVDEEDLAQDIFLKIFTKLDQFNATSTFPAWVSRIALHTCIDSLRRQRARPLFTYADLNTTQSEFLEHALDSASSSTGTPLSLADPLARDLLNNLISKLKPAEQIVIRLLDLEENSVDETCALTGWGASKVKVTAMRARRKLSAQLQDLEKNARP
ncbi:RNA polymerase sigma factor [soil metagenome]